MKVHEKDPAAAAELANMSTDSDVSDEKLNSSGSASAQSPNGSSNVPLVPPPAHSSATPQAAAPAHVNNTHNGLLSPPASGAAPPSQPSATPASVTSHPATNLSDWYVCQTAAAMPTPPSTDHSPVHPHAGIGHHIPSLHHTALAQY